MSESQVDYTITNPIFSKMARTILINEIKKSIECTLEELVSISEIINEPDVLETIDIDVLRSIYHDIDAGVFDWALEALEESK